MENILRNEGYELIVESVKFLIDTEYTFKIKLDGESKFMDMKFKFNELSPKGFPSIEVIKIR